MFSSLCFLQNKSPTFKNNTFHLGDDDFMLHVFIVNIVFYSLQTAILHIFKLKAQIKTMASVHTVINNLYLIKISHLSYIS